MVTINRCAAAQAPATPPRNGGRRSVRSVGLQLTVLTHLCKLCAVILLLWRKVERLENVITPQERHHMVKLGENAVTSRERHHDANLL